MIKNCLCYFPTSVAIVDDSRSFLSMVDKMLNKVNKKQPRLLFNNPKVALQKINALEKPSQDFKYILKEMSPDKINEIENKSGTNILVDIDLQWLYQKIYSFTRFNCVPVILVDYSMPGMNGIEFCRQLKDRAIKKIMITSMLEYKPAVQAFNEGIIDKFVLKNSPNLFEQINASICEAQNEYFKKIYGKDGILGFVFRGLRLFEDDYYKFLVSVSKKIDFVEYYIFDKSGSVLFLNEKGQSTWLIIKAKEDLEELYAVAKDHHAVRSILMKLRTKKASPVLLSENDYHAAVSNWKMYPFKPISPRGKYFYTIIKGSAVGNLDVGKIKSLDQYWKK